MDALDAAELDVAGGGGSADPGLRAVGVQAGEGLGDVAYDLVLVDDADVQVGQQGDHPAALAGAVVEHDGAGLGDADRGTGDDRVDGVELGVGQPFVEDRARDVELEPGGTTTDAAPSSAAVMVAARSAAVQRVTVAR